MKNEIEMTLLSRLPLTERHARDQISALSGFASGLMRPEKCSDVEPIRTSFDAVDIGVPTKWLAQPHGSFLYRKGRPAHVCGQMWNRIHSPAARFPSPLFCNYWTGQFDGKWAYKVGIDRIQDFVAEMFQITKADFGMLTTSVDRAAKNTDDTSYSYQGFDLEQGIPGVYWVNFFSNALAEWLCLADLPVELAVRQHLPGGGMLLKFCESPDRCRDSDVLSKQRETIEWLGSDKFFDIRFPNRKLNAFIWEPIHRK